MRQQLLHDGVKPDLLNTIPHGFDPEPYKQPAVATLRKDFGLSDDAILIAFHGTFSYPPNRDAMQVFAEILLPQLAHSNHSFSVIAIGRNPPAESPHPDIHFTGSVEEVGPWLKACDLAVIPLREGGGTRMKIIDCFAAGLPVISTSKGIEGIPVVAGKQALILDDWEAIITAVIELWENQEKAESLAREGRALAENLSWDTIAGKYQSLYNALC